MVIERTETRVRSLAWEDPLEKEIVTHSSILAWGIPWTEEPGGLQSMASPRKKLSQYLPVFLGGGAGTWHVGWDLGPPPENEPVPPASGSSLNH